MKAKVTLNARALIAATNACTIYNQFCAQRGRDIMTGKSAIAEKVTPEQVRAFAAKCHESLQLQLSACKTDKQVSALWAALREQVGAHASGYLLASA